MERLIYSLAYGRHFIWLVPTNGSTDDIYLLSEDNHSGFSGDKTTFQMKNGSKLTWKGPINSNPDSLYEDTGIRLV